ncbi:hypothetical protein HWV62_19343 [Athelia sp. TMB]|nr:hypothetical protein HWV62_19343 [Athelia sp. TMB]
MPQCLFCSKGFKSADALNRHQSQTPKCLRARRILRKRVFQQARECMLVAAPASPAIPADNLEEGLAMPESGEDHSGSSMEVDEPETSITGDAQDMLEADQDACAPLQTTIEEIEDEDAHRTYGCRPEWVNPFPDAGQCLGARAKTNFEMIRDTQILKGDEVLGPFESDDEWQLAKWLIKNVGHNQAEEFLRLPIVQDRVSPSFHNKDALLDTADALPQGTEWKCRAVKLVGDIEDDNKDIRTEKLELWYRDPIDVVRELMGNPVFRDVMHYSPEQVYRDKDCEERVVNEMWTGHWWWEMQKRLPPGATIAPLILSSDKTRLSQFRGDKSAWPVYLTVGNISKDVRRQASSHVTVLIGYIPVGKFDCYSDKTRLMTRYRLFHHCMSMILESLAEAGHNGVDMVCADGFARKIWPILAAYVADYPEQCLIACCMENRCPICTVHPDNRGSHIPAPARSKGETISMLIRDHNGEDDTDFRQYFKTLGLRGVYPPFWATLPHTDIFKAFTPDLLHQLHKGVFKDHLVKWCTELVGEAELDARFGAIPSHPGLRHFKNGISSVSQWTGAEHKEMEKVFVGILASVGVDQRVITAVCAILDFIYYTSLHTHTTTTLNALRDSLDTFHSNKNVFVELEARTPGHFNIPKIHSMEHYLDLISNFGSADGYNTESPERLHIDYAKDAYRASNKKDYTSQMTVWLARQEAVDRFQAYLNWCRTGPLSFHRSPHNLVNSHHAPGPSVDPLADHEDESEAITITPSPTPSAAQLYKVAKHHPPSLTSIPATQIIENHGAGRFLEAISAFLVHHNSSIQPHRFDTFCNSLC